jgi:hypothetical protein
MVLSMSTVARPLVLVGLGLCASCTDESKSDAPAREPQDAATAAAIAPAPPSPTTAETARDSTGPVDSTAATVATSTSTPTSTSTSSAKPFRGPCQIVWSDGAKLRFRYKDTSGSVVVDGDGDGQSDVCSRFRLADGRTRSVTIDIGCDRTTDITIRPRYADDANLAEATYTVTDGDEKKRRRVTLVTMPSFAGLDPGYPIPASRRRAGLEIEDGLVRGAHVESPSDGSAELAVRFAYDQSGRIERVTEDIGKDGTIDRSYTYRYDDTGNVIRISATAGDVKRSARIDYSCWR